LKFNEITVDQSVFKFQKGQSNLFGGEMSLVCIAIIVIIFTERFASRTDTKAAENKRLS